jgi:hypothetical protein
MALHRLLFDAANSAESANVGAFLRMGDTGKLASYSSRTIAGDVVFSFVDGDVTTGSDSIAETAHGLETGDIVRLTTTGVLPAGLALATNYWVIRVDADNFKLASSLANAEAGTAVDITAAAGGGTHTVTESERVHAAIDVNLVNTLTISATDLDIRDLSHTQDSVKIGDGTDFLAIDASGNIGVTDAGGSLTVDAVNLDIRDLAFATDKVDVTGSEVSLDAGTLAALENITVSATDLDIRDLTHASDSVKIGDGTDFLAIAADGSIAVTDNGASLTVDAVNLDIRDLAAATDSVSAWMKDGAGTALTSTLVGAKQSLDVNVANDILVDDTANTAIAAAASTVSTSAALIASPLADRKYVAIYNNGSKAVYIGPSGVSTSSGFPVHVGGILEARVGSAVAIHAVAESGSQNIRTLELS